MSKIDFEQVLKNFSDEAMDYKARNKDHMAYMIKKAESIFFIRVYDATEDKEPYVSVTHYISQLPESFDKKENMLAIACNMVNTSMDNGTTTTYVTNGDESSFISIKAINIYIDDALASVEDKEKIEHTVTMFLYSAIIEISSTRIFLFKIMNSGVIKNENS